MHDDAYIAEVRDRAGLATDEQARRAVRGVLHALANRLPDGWVHHLAAELPTALAEPLWTYQHLYDQEVHVDFLADVAARAGVPAADAGAVARAVLGVVARSSDPAFLRRVFQPLTHDVLRYAGDERTLLPA